MLIKGVDYTLTITIENYFGQVAALTVSTSMALTANVIQTKIIGPQVLDVTKNKELTLLGAVQLSDCTSFADKEIIYEWKVYKDYAYDETIQSTSVDLKVLRIAPSTLTAGMTYRIFFTATASKKIFTSTGYQSFHCTDNFFHLLFFSSFPLFLSLSSLSSSLTSASIFFNFYLFILFLSLFAVSVLIF